MMKKLFLGMFLLLLTSAVGAQQTMSPSGDWQVRLDGGEPQKIVLPNTLDGAGIGTEKAV